MTTVQWFLKLKKGGWKISNRKRILNKIKNEEKI